MQTQFFTGKGDFGESRVGKVSLPKSHPIFKVLGGLDELNSWLGFAKVKSNPPAGGENTKNVEVAPILKQIQETLFIAQAEMAHIAFGLGGDKKIKKEKTEELEKIILEIDKIVPPITNFIIPGGTELAARLDVARTFARRVERDAKRLAEQEKISEDFLKYLNRLSSILFALARYANFVEGVGEDHPSYS